MLIMKILFKYPSRGRVNRFIQGMDSIVDNMYDKENYHILVTADEDDPDMVAAQTVIEMYPNTTVIYGTSKSKIDAVNRDMDKSGEWDIVCVMSDDMRITQLGFDEILRAEFIQHGLDIMLHVPDNDAKSALATMYIAGKKFVDRFGYLYNNEYKSLFCDNEVMDVSKMLGCYRYLDFPNAILHLNPAYGHLERDEMFNEQQNIGWTEDQETYNRRKANNFYL